MDGTEIRPTPFETFKYLPKKYPLDRMGDDGKRPLDALGRARGKRIIVHLKSGEKLTGKLEAFDLHLNLWLEEAERMMDEKKTRLGTIVVRGDNVLLASPE